MNRLTVWLGAGAAVLALGGSGAYICAQTVEQSRLREALTRSPADIVARMSLEEKVGQLIHIGMRGKDAHGAVRNDIDQFHPGGVILFAVNLGEAARIRSLTAGLQQRSIASSGIPLLISIDQEGGRVVRVGPDGVDQFPAAMALGQSGDAELVEDVGFMTGYQLRKLGINLALAPVLDVNNNPANPVINTRSFGSDPTRVSQMGLALARGLRQARSIPMIKHFPGHGDTNVDSHLALPIVRKPIDIMRSTELAPFRDAIADGAEAVMSAHIVFESFDAENPATLSPRILKGLLRGEMGFRGIVMTDAMEMNAISRRYARGDAARRAFEAGADVVLLTSDGAIIREKYQALLNAFRNGELPVADLDRAVLRQIRLKLERGLFHQYASPLKPESVELEQELRAKDQAVEERLLALQAKYQARQVSLNRAASRAGVASLRRSFSGLPADKLTNVRLLYSSEEARQQGLELGLKAEQLIAAPRSSDLYQIFRKRRESQIWLIEFDERSAGAFQRVVQVSNATRERRLKGTTIGLLAGSPFVRVTLPTDGVVLCAFSGTPESRRALVYRALSPLGVRQADLVLPPP